MSVFWMCSIRKKGTIFSSFLYFFKSPIVLWISQKNRQFFLPFWIFPGLSSKENKTNVAADPALFQRLPENRFCDVVKKIPINYTISASEIVVLGRARSLFYAAKFKKVINTGDLTFSLNNCALNTPNSNLIWCFK